MLECPKHGIAMVLMETSAHQGMTVGGIQLLFYFCRECESIWAYDLVEETFKALTSISIDDWLKVTGGVK